MQSSLKLLLVFLLAVGVMDGYAQSKLPDKQPAGLWVPADKVKINGKADEWDNKYQAYNHATNLFYTVANNDEFLYLIIHAEDHNVIETIATYGFTFGVQKEKKNSKNNDAIVINFPYYSFFKSFFLRFTLYKQGAAHDTSVSIEKNIMNTNNKTLQKHKVIAVNGIEGLDSLSVYNDVGIRVGEAFDMERTYTLEMAIPIKYINKLNGGASKFYYHLLINGREAANIPMNVPPGGLAPEDQAATDKILASMNAKWARTDFWGEYTLVKKP